MPQGCVQRSYRLLNRSRLSFLSGGCRSCAATADQQWRIQAQRLKVYANIGERRPCFVLFGPCIFLHAVSSQLSDVFPALIRLAKQPPAPGRLWESAAKKTPILTKFFNFKRILANLYRLGCTIPPRSPQGEIWPETCKLRAAIAGRNSPSALLIRRSFRNAVTRPQSVAEIAVRQGKTREGDPATVRLLHRELL